MIFDGNHHIVEFLKKFILKNVFAPIIEFIPIVTPEKIVIMSTIHRLSIIVIVAL